MRVTTLELFFDLVFVSTIARRAAAPQVAALAALVAVAIGRTRRAVHPLE